MTFKILFLLLVAGIAVFNVNAAISPTTMFIKQRAEEALQEQNLKATSDLSSCHDHYSEVLKKLLETYDANIKQCEATENEQLSELSNAEQASRDAATESLNRVCSSLKVCEGEDENLNFFDCVSGLGDNNTRAIWKASRDSSDSAAQIREKDHVIKFAAEKCSNDAERGYIVGTTKATDEMVACYANGGLVTSTAPPDEESGKQNEAKETEENAVRNRLENLMKNWGKSV